MMADQLADTTGDSGLSAAGRQLDLSGSRQIDSTLRAVRDLSSAKDPRDVFEVYGRWRSHLRGGEAYVSLSTRGLAAGEYKITRLMELDEVGRAAQTDDPWRDWHDLPVQTGGILGRIVRGARPQIFHGLDLSKDPVLGGRLDGYRSMMAMPLFDDGQVLNWAIPLRTDAEGFTVDQLEESLMRGNLVGMTTRHTLVMQRLNSAKAALDVEVKKIGAIQRSLLPRPLPKVPGVTMAASYTTSDQAGGDLYDVLRVQGERDEPRESSGRWALLIADASGHGPAAATVIAMMHAFLRAYTGQPLGPGEVLSRVNAHLCSRNADASFVTAFLGIFDVGSNTLTYSNAGHPPPLVKSANGIERLDGAALFPLGVVDGAAYEHQTRVLSETQTMLLYTDGVTEARDGDGKMFGIDGIERAIRACDGDTACMVASIGDAIRLHQGGDGAQDDQTLLAVRFGRAR